MGFFTASGPAHLQPFSPPLGVNLAFCVNVPTTMILKEKAFSFSGDDFSVKDTNGQVVLRCKGKALSFIGDRKVITDSNGRVLFHLRNKLIAIFKTFIGENDKGQELFRIKNRFGFGSHMQATFINASTSQEVVLTLRGDFWGGSADITIGDRPVAQISRKLFNMREIFVDKQTYFVTVAPGVDLSLIAAVCICFDEAENENRSN